MKLYTELDIYQVIADARYYQEQMMPSKKIVQKLTPIELPSDDDMANASNHCKDGQVKVGFLRGVLWYQEQILNQNK